MTIRMLVWDCRVVSMGLLSLLLFAPPLARAQEPAHTLQELQSRIDQGDTVRLDGADSEQIEGTVLSVTSSALKLKVNGVSREFQEPQIREIKAKYSDPIGNGLKWGAIIGGVSGAVVGAIISDAFCDGCGNAHGSGALAFGLLGTGIGVGVGGLGDYLKKGYTPVFQAQKVAGKGFGVSPLLSKKTKGVAVAFRF